MLAFILINMALPWVLPLWLPLSTAQYVLQVGQYWLTTIAFSLDLFVIMYVVGLWRNKYRFGSMVDKWVGQEITEDAKLVQCYDLLKKADQMLAEGFVDSDRITAWREEYRLV
jgi:hypothetical protein